MVVDNSMELATWWVGDPVPFLRSLPHFYANPVDDDELVAELSRGSAQEGRRRLAAGHRPYVGYLRRTPVAWAWLATRTASIEELHVAFTLAGGDRYLWDVSTVQAGHRPFILAHLLRAIVAQEWPDAERFWILQAHEYLHGETGWQQAGFTTVGVLAMQPPGGAVLSPTAAHERAKAAAALLGVVLAGGEPG